jgi:NACalpha-BTF3-like transcription factor
MDLIINDHERSPASLTCALEFAPHPSQIHKYTNQPQSNQIDLKKALGNQQSANVSEEDVQTIMDQTECNRATAINALGKEDGDVISCIMNIDSHKCDDVPVQPSANNGSNVPREITIQGVDIDTVMKATGCNETTAINALANELNNVPNSIQNIKKYVSEESVQEGIYSQEPAKASSDDVETIMEQTECNRATAIKALHAENNDVIACIMNIDQYRVDDNKDAKPDEEEPVSLEVEE